MERITRKLPAIVAFCAVLAPAPKAALGQQVRPRPQDTIGASHGQIAGAIAGIAGAGIALGIGVTLAIKHNNHAVTGCTRSGPDGLVLTSDPDKQGYTLVGDVAGIKPGDRVRVSGKGKEKSTGTHQFLVEKVSKNFGACEVAGDAH